MPDSRSPEARVYRRWYYTTRWRELRKAQLQREPWCHLCHAAGRRTRASIVDHRTPHRGNPDLFFDPGNLASLCKPHHDATKQREEAGRRQVALGADGWPAAQRGG